MQETLAFCLEVGVPLRTHEIKKRNGPSDFDLARCREFAPMLASKGDVLLFRSNKKGETGELMARLIDAIAVLACMPGGVDFLGLHWEA
jgi:hypothetical protein